jgi:hypothetical protein
MQQLSLFSNIQSILICVETVVRCPSHESLPGPAKRSDLDSLHGLDPLERRLMLKDGIILSERIVFY